MPSASRPRWINFAGGPKHGPSGEAKTGGKPSAAFGKPDFSKKEKNGLVLKQEISFIVSDNY